jgi:hypothetical protein
MFDTRVVHITLCVPTQRADFSRRRQKYYYVIHWLLWRSNTHIFVGVRNTVCYTTLITSRVWNSIEKLKVRGITQGSKPPVWEGDPISAFVREIFSCLQVLEVKNPRSTAFWELNSGSDGSFVIIFMRSVENLDAIALFFVRVIRLNPLSRYRVDTGSTDTMASSFPNTGSFYHLPVLNQDANSVSSLSLGRGIYTPHYTVRIYIHILSLVFKVFVEC